MPMIDSKITISVSNEKREILKSKLGSAISILGKPESYLMLGFEDKYDLYFAGKKLDKGAFISVKLFGNEDSVACNNMTAKICEIFNTELDIPGENIYITYSGFNNWGWNGCNF